MLCEQLGLPIDKQSRRSVSNTELISLLKTAKQCSKASVILALAVQLTRSNGRYNMFVLPDLLTAVTCGFVGPADGTTAAAAAAEGAAEQQQQARRNMGQLLLCSCLYPDQPIPLEGPHTPSLSADDLQDMISM